MALDVNDYFGWDVSLDGNRLAVGVREGDGFETARLRRQSYVV